MAIINNYIYDSNTSTVFYGSYDTQWLGIAKTPQETWSLATQDQINNYLLKPAIDKISKQISQDRQILQYSNITYNGNIFSATQTAIQNLNAVVTLTIGSGQASSNSTFVWLDINNNSISMKFSDLISFGGIVANRTNSLYVQDAKFQNELKKLSTIDEVNNFKYKFIL